MTPEELMMEIQESQKRLRNKMDISWKDAEEYIILSMDAQNFPTSPNVRKMFLMLFKMVWEKGYLSGNQDMIEEAAHQLGMDDTMKAVKAAMNFDPRNN